MKYLVLLVMALLLIPAFTGCTEKESVVVLETGMGVIKIKVYDDKVPVTASNFLKLVKSGFYDGLIFHRIVRNFVIQAGAFYPNGTYKPSPYGPIKLEINKELKHDDGAVGMARGNDKDSATSQFYICVGDHHNLDGGYAVFGKVIEGMDVVRAIDYLDPEHTISKSLGPNIALSNWPADDVLSNVTILKAYVEE
ncbi:MAG: peptidylprolyl isomerase [Thermoplasmata archaeon]|nr:peptidylprolyl isomerase [Thermoplasmata archaeon]